MTEQDDPPEAADDAASRRARPLFDKPAVLKNPAVLPEPGERKDPVEAAFAKATEDLAWLDKPEPSEEERAARRERREAHKRKVRRRRRNRRIAVVLAGGLCLLLVAGLLWYRYTFGGLERMPRVAGQAGANTPGENFLVVGTNPREPVAGRDTRLGWANDFANSDLVMVLHLDRDKHSMYVISIPGSTAVDLPGRGAGRLSDAYDVGGAKLYVRTVEELTGLRFDRVMTLDLNAFGQMADILGGVEVTVPAAVCDEPRDQRRLDGQGALEYIALRPCMPNKDLDRVARQQSLMKALMRAAVDGGTVTHPLRVNRLLRAGAAHTTLEDGFGFPSMLGTLWGMRGLRTSNTTFLTVPAARKPILTVDGVDYVRLDEQKDADLWAAVRADRIAEYLQLSGAPVS
ncbi:MAG: LCP family protein [Nocardioidaceae bacterium]|nr:LCP family protein [Nocardioidaceae bacterium]